MQTINTLYPFDIQVIQQRNEECDHTQFLIEEKESKEEDFYEDLDRFEENGTQESRISPYTFCKAFPFHIIFDRDLVVTQCGNAIYRVLPQVSDVMLPWGLRQRAIKALLLHVTIHLFNLFTVC